jgi:glycerophosphoryl diester phosphodiesterase
MTAFDLSAFAYAHRGLWNENVPENSLTAFSAAFAAGVGCELDVRATADGKLVVFHDPTLDRMCRETGRIDRLPFSMVRKAKLPDGSQIPTLEEDFEAMAGLPILVELKTDASRRDGDGNHAGIPALLETLNSSRAPAALMTFDEDALGHFEGRIGERPLGMLLEPDGPDDEGWAVMKAIRTSQRECTFLAPHISSLPYIADQFAYLPRVTWTVRDLPQLAAARADGAAPIFEGFSPDLAKTFANTI